MSLESQLDRFGVVPFSHGSLLTLVSNLLRGPSCVSLDYALSWYGLLPEGVTALCDNAGAMRALPRWMSTLRAWTSSGSCATQPL